MSTENLTEDDKKIPSQAEIGRLTQRFKRTQEKVQKLEYAIQKLEGKYGDIDHLTTLLSTLDDKLSEINEQHQKCIDSLNKESEGLLKNLEDSFSESVQAKINETDQSIQEKLEDFSSYATEAQGCIDHRKDELESKFNEVSEWHESVANNNDEISKMQEVCSEATKKIQEQQEITRTILERAEMALTSATSAGLAKAFEIQKDKLKLTQICWILGLIIALVVALVVAQSRLTVIQELLRSPNATSGLVIFVHCIISVLSVAAPVWFAWLATKQIGYNFRLSEDYAFKAAIAASFEGFRKEVENLATENDGTDELRQKLLKTLLMRLDEQPLRYVGDKVAGSPIHEIFPQLKTGKNEKETTP